MRLPTVHCENFTLYASRREVMWAIAKARRSKRSIPSRDGRRAYFCVKCGGWHMGHWLSGWIG